MSFDIVVRDRIQAGIDTKLKRIELQASATGRALQRMRGLLSNVNSNLGLSATTRTFAGWATGLATVNKRLTTLTTGLARAGQIARRLAAGAFLIQGTSYLTDALDSYQNLQNRLGGVSAVFDDQNESVLNVAQSTERLTELTRQLFDVADRARVPVTSLAKTYRRLDIALKQTGASQAESMRITETAAKLLSLSGANAGEATSALLQLSQAFNKGKLDGDEFRSVAELMPAAIDAIANRLGIMRGEIFDASKDGKITIDILRGAFEDLAKTTDEAFTRLPRTIGQAFVQLTNKITQAFGQSSDASSFTGLLISFIDYIKNNLPTIIRLFKALIGTMAVNTVANFVGSLFTAQGIVSALTTALAASIPYFIYFSDRIKVSADGVVTLHDVFIGLYQTIREMVANGTGFLGKIFSVEGAQGAFDFIFGWLKTLNEFILGMVSGVHAFYDTWMSLSWGDIGTIISEALEYTGLLMVKWGIKLVIKMAEIGASVGDALIDAFLDTMKTLNSIAFAAAGGVPWIGKDLQKGFRNIGKELDSLKRKKIDWGVSDALQDELRKVEGWLKTSTPMIDRATLEWKKSYRLRYMEMSEMTDGFYKSIMEKARANADARIKEQKRMEEAMQPNPDALRQSGTANFTAPSAAANVSDSATPAVLYFGRAKKEREEQKQLYNEVTNGIESVGQKLKKAGQSPDILLNLKESATSLNLNIGQATTAVERYAAAAKLALSSVGTSAIQTGDTIRWSQVSAWMDATTAMNIYADSTIAKMKEVSAAVNSANTGGGYTVENRINWLDGGDRPGRYVSYSKGGYTGNGGTNQVAGLVHGQEFVMPADATRQHRGTLEAMRNGQSPSSGSGGANVMVSIENYGSSTHTVEQIGPNEIRIIAREEADKATSVAFRHGVSNANSPISKALRSSTRTKRRR